MRTSGKLGFLIVVTLLAAWPAASQMGMRTPDIRGVWNPVVGAGAAYEIDGKAGKSELELTIVGKEDVAGKPGFWVEMALDNPGAGGKVLVKNLMVIDGKNTSVARMIIQPAGHSPMEMDGILGAMMNRAGAAPAPSTDFRDEAEHVGAEDVTTPAGTFSCEHYRSKDGRDVWISTKVTPWGLVKTSGGGDNMIVTRVITDAKDQITGTPQKFDPSQFIPQRGQPPR